MPAVLRRLMRHKDISTTLKYYVDQDAEEIAADLWAAYRKGNNSGNIGPERAKNAQEAPADSSAEPPDLQDVTTALS